MIKALSAGYLKFDSENSKRIGGYLVLEMTIKSMPHIHLIVISQDGLVLAEPLESLTEIAGYHRYVSKSGLYLGAGELKPLDTANDKGMLEGLAKQIGFNYQSLATAFGEGILRING